MSWAFVTCIPDHQTVVQDACTFHGSVSHQLQLWMATKTTSTDQEDSDDATAVEGIDDSNDLYHDHKSK